MSLKTSWPLRCAVALLVAQLASACGGGGTDPNPNPTPAQDTAAPTTKATPPGGNFSQTVAVALVCEDGSGTGCAATYYTLDGSTPGTGSTLYREPFTLSATTTLRFFSVDTAGNAEAVKSEQYTFTSGADTQAPTTTATPAGGAYNSPRSVALTCADGAGSGCAATYYTLDGSVPTEVSSRYAAPLAISASTTLRFFSVDQAGNAEGTRTERYVLDTDAPTVSASPRTGTYGSAVDVVLACDDGNGSGCAAIHYTTDGAIPSEASPAYTTAIHLTATTRLRFLAVDRAGNASEPGSEVYTLDGTGPVSTATPRGGTYRSAFTVTLGCDDGAGSGCAATYYTTTGATPTRASSRFTAPIAITGNTTLRFFSVDAAGNDGPGVTETYVVDQAAPVTRATPPGRSYGGEQFVTLECEDTAGSGCAATYYTLDGSAPTSASPLYVAPVRVSSSLTLRFFSVDTAGNAEAVKTEPYLIDLVAPTASASVPSGTYSTAQSVTLTCDDGTGSGCAAIHYTLDGSLPTLGSAVYSAPLQLSANTTLRFFAVDGVGNQSGVQSRTYSIDTTAPLTTATPAGGTFGSDTQVTLTCDDGQGGSGCASTRYTLDGTVPSDASPLYGGPLTVTSSATLRFFSVDTVGNREAVRVVSFTLDRVAPTTTVSLRGGNFSSAQTVSLSCTDTGGSTCAATYYTLDGSVPTTASARYSAAFQFSSTTTLRFFSVDAVGNAETAKAETYVIDTTPPVTTASPAGRLYSGAVDVTLTCDDAGGVGCAGAIRYSTDPDAPTGSFLTYSGPIRISADTTLRFFSQDGVGNVEAVKTETYDIEIPTPTASEQIAAVRAAANGPVNLLIDGARITYVKPAIGSTLNDPAGFFLQAEFTGPAIFVEVDPSTLLPVPVGGERVSVIVSERLTVNGQARARISTYAVLSYGSPTAGLVQDVSNVDLPPQVDAYESEVISISGTIGSTGFVSGGTGHVQAPLVTVGVPEGSTSASSLRLRVVETVKDELDLAPLCTLTVVSPLWRFVAVSQPSVWERSHVTALTCPAPKVASAQAGSLTTVVVRFDRRIDPATLQSNGSQFSIPGMTVASAVVSDRSVWLTTSNQTPRQSYTVTVASTVRDTMGKAVDPVANSATFTGYVQPAVLRISEFAPAVPLGRDLVELSVVQAGSVLGATLVDGSVTLATLPDVVVAMGDTLVVHLNPDRASGADGPGSETTGKSQYLQATYVNNYDTAWDFQGGTTGIGTGNRTLRIRDTFGVTQDAIAVATAGNSFTGYPAQLQALQAEGQWSPSSCGGALCTYTSFPTAWEVSVDWTSAFSMPGKSVTVSRVVSWDSDWKDDWSVVGETLGRPNP